jgi:hypothetical protein
MLPVRASAPDPELAACRRVLIRCADELAAGGRRLQALDLGTALTGPCAAALLAAAQSVADDLRAVGAAIEDQAAELSRPLGR